jgi:hypothetical protein
MSTTKTAAARHTYPPDAMAAPPNGWSLFNDVTDAARITRSAKAFKRYLSITQLKMEQLIKVKMVLDDDDYAEPMTEFWLYTDPGTGVEVIAVAFDRSLNRPNNDSTKRRQTNDWYITVGVHPDNALTLDDVYDAIKVLVAYQLSLADLHYPNPGIKTRQLFTAWRIDSVIKLAELPDAIFDKMMRDPDISLSVDPGSATDIPPFGHFRTPIRKVQIFSITI